MVRQLSKISIGIVLLSIGQAAHAGNAKCLWNNLSEGTRAAIIERYQKDGEAGIVSVTITEAALARSVRECDPLIFGKPKALGTAWGASLRGYSFEVAVVQYFNVTENLPVETLPEIWEFFSEEERQTLRDAAERAVQSTGGFDLKTYETVAVGAMAAGWKPTSANAVEDDPRFRRYLDYFIGRAMRDVFEGRF